MAISPVARSATRVIKSSGSKVLRALHDAQAAAAPSATMGSAQSKWGARDAAVVLAAASIVPVWSRWLNEQQTVRQQLEDGDEGEGRSARNGKLAPPKEWIFYRPTSAKHLAQGFGSTFAYLALLDVLVARKA
eukprot:2748007-Prymnesium_polylepis.1